MPASFVTGSHVIGLANEWRSLNANVQAPKDLAIALHLDPSNDEVHRAVGGWLRDAEVHDLNAGVLPAAGTVSMRHYHEGSQLRGAGLSDWRRNVLRMVLADDRSACVIALEYDSALRSEQERVERFVCLTGASRATYFRTKDRLCGLRFGRGVP